VPKGKPFWVGIALYGLVPEKGHTLSLFGEEKRSRLSLAMDKINRKYGKDAIYFGGISSALDSAPTRIAFTSVPDVDD